MSQQEAEDLKKLTEAVERCHIEETEPPRVELSEKVDHQLLNKFPKPKNKIPPVFLHKPAKFPPHMRRVLDLGIQFYKPIVGHHYTKICCLSFADQKALLNYFDSKSLPHHTYGIPEARIMRIVIKGLPEDLDVELVIDALKSVSIPVVRAHKMQNQNRADKLPALTLVLVPNNNEGRKILLVEKLFGYEIQMEPPKSKNLQCFRCQKWGHSQRYCRGRPKCVKCGNNHFSKRCQRDPIEEPPKCANCSSLHTSNFKKCAFCPTSAEYINKMTSVANNKAMFPSVCPIPKKIITLKNYHQYVRGRM